MQRRPLNIVQFCDDPPKTSTKSLNPFIFLIFLKTPKNIEIQNFNPPKMASAYVCMKISEHPPPPQTCDFPGWGSPLWVRAWAYNYNIFIIADVVPLKCAGVPIKTDVMKFHHFELIGDDVLNFFKMTSKEGVN